VAASKPIDGIKESKQAEATPATATAAEPTLTFGQKQEASNRPWLLVMLVGTVVAAAFIVGVWWKVKTAQIGGAMVQNQPIAEPIASATRQKASSPAVTIESPDSDGLSANEPESTPANPQELSKFPRVTAVRHWSSGDSSTVVLDLEDQVQYEPGHLSNPERFYFDLRDTQLAPELEGKSFEGDALLSRIRIAQPVSGMTRVVLEPRPSANVSAPQVSLERDPYRLVIQVNKPGTAPKGAVNLFPTTTPEAEKAKLAIVVPPPTKEDLQLRARVPKMRIVVDAGHGGWDLGTVGRRGLLEKDLVLEIAQRLGKLLESRLGADVIYTRQDDNYLPLDDRAVVANQAQADLFISVHANYSDLPSARGVETYYTNFFSAPGSKDLPANATPKEVAMRSMPKNVPAPTLTANELHERIEQSRRLATTVQRSLYGTLSLQNPGLRDRGIKEAGFVVLTESAMPGILAEVSFVSSPTDEQKLRSDGYREQIAEALYRGIARYAAAKTVKVAAK
jgi:N-acetylmuramoyl-L-alanine amidase